MAESRVRRFIVFKQTRPQDGWGYQHSNLPHWPRFSYVRKSYPQVKFSHLSGTALAKEFVSISLFLTLIKFFLEVPPCRVLCEGFLSPSVNDQGLTPYYDTNDMQIFFKETAALSYFVIFYSSPYCVYKIQILMRFTQLKIIVISATWWM